MTRHRLLSFDREIELSLFDDDHVTRVIAATNTFYENELLEDIMRKTSADDLAVDVGAHIGNHTVFLAGVADLDVIAIEPSKEAADLLRENVERNRLESRVQIVEAAAGAGEGTATLVAGDRGNTGMTRVVASGDDVTVTTVDALVGDRRVAVLKVDVEGWEPDVIRGARGVIARDEPLIYVEVSDARQERLLRDMLRDLGYRFAREFNATPTRLFLPTGTSIPALYPPLLAELTTEQTRAVTQLMRTVTRMEREVLSTSHKLEALVRRWDEMIALHEREMREYREQLRKTTGLFGELYKRTRSATQSNNEVLEALSEIRDSFREAVGSPQDSTIDESPPG